MFAIILRDIIGLENFLCLQANHNPELACAICTGVTLEMHCSRPIRINFFSSINYYKPRNQRAIMWISKYSYPIFL